MNSDKDTLSSNATFLNDCLKHCSYHGFRNHYEIIKMNLKEHN